jgi:hypothetical protein
VADERAPAATGHPLLHHPSQHTAGRDGGFERDLAIAVEYARERAGTKPRSGATYGGGGVEAARDAVAAGMVAGLDATQALPPAPR